MLEQVYVDMPQYNVYTNSVSPLVHYLKEHKELAQEIEQKIRALVGIAESAVPIKEKDKDE